MATILSNHSTKIDKSNWISKLINGKGYLEIMAYGVAIFSSLVILFG